MIKRFHGIDLHKHYATISIRDELGKEIKRISKCINFEEYVRTLTSEDAVVIETLSNAFYWADEIEKQGACCILINSYKFKIISESWTKTDKKDAAALSLALWVSMTSNEFILPTVYKPDPVIRDLRKLFSQYLLLNKQIRQYKNIIQARLLENGVVLTDAQKEQLFNPKKGLELFDTFSIDHTTQICVVMNLYLLWNLIVPKEILKREIYKAGISLKEKVKLLITIKGVTPLFALAFLADVGDITRFPSIRKMNAYLGVVPKVKSSGGKTQMGRINKQSRNLSRSLFTQGLIHLVNASPDLYDFYEETKIRRGAGRSRIAVLRKIFAIMRRMLLSGEEFRYKNTSNYSNKLYEYERELNRLEHLANAS